MFYTSAIPSPTFPLQAAFLALPLAGEAKVQYRAVQERLKPWDDILRFQPPETVHLTLKYWGSLMEIEYAPILETARSIATRTAPFTVQLGPMETFERRGEIQVLFLGCSFSPELATVKKLCPWPNEQPFHPHVTLARVRHPQRLHIAWKHVEKVMKDVSFPVTFDRLALYAMVEGKRQTLLEEFPFSRDPTPPTPPAA